MTSQERIYRHGARSPMRWRLALAVASALALAGLTTGCSNSVRFRYRLNVTLLVNGQPKTASSVIEVEYYGLNARKGGLSDMPAYMYYRGVAPYFDLGRNGLLFAGMNYSSDEGSRQFEITRHDCGRANATMFPGVFGFRPSGLSDIPEGKTATVPPKLYPRFIWVPDGGPYTSAKQICADRLEETLGLNLRFQSATVEVARHAPLLTWLPIKAAWLDKIRKDQAHGITRGVDYLPDLKAELETGERSSR